MRFTAWEGLLNKCRKLAGTAANRWHNNQRLGGKSNRNVCGASLQDFLRKLGQSDAALAAHAAHVFICALLSETLLRLQNTLCTLNEFPSSQPAIYRLQFGVETNELFDRPGREPDQVQTLRDPLGHALVCRYR